MSTPEELLREGFIKRIHVDQHAIRANIKAKTRRGMRPPVTVQTSAGSLKGWTVEVGGPSTVIYRPDSPLSCGARLWIETTSVVSLDSRPPEFSNG